MKPGYCSKHGAQRFTITSPKLATLIKQEIAADKAILRRLLIESDGTAFEYFVDKVFLEEFGISSDHNTIFLKDRNKTLKQLNDRALIQRITKGMQWVCIACLNEIIGNDARIE